MSEACGNTVEGEDGVYYWKILLFQENVEKVNDIESKPRIYMVLLL